MVYLTFHILSLAGGHSLLYKYLVHFEGSICWGRLVLILGGGSYRQQGYRRRPFFETPEQSYVNVNNLSNLCQQTCINQSHAIVLITWRISLQHACVWHVKTKWVSFVNKLASTNASYIITGGVSLQHTFSASVGILSQFPQVHLTKYRSVGVFVYLRGRLQRLLIV